MKRKVVLHGLSTLTVSLPSKWARKNNVKRGDEVDIEVVGDKIIILSDGSGELKEKSIDVSKIEPIIRRTLKVIYQHGYDDINVKFDNPRMMKKIRDSINRELIGLEVIEQSKDKCKIKDVTGISDNNFYPLIKRLFIIVEGSLSDGLESIKSSDSTLMQSVIDREADINRVSNFCFRFLNKKGDEHFVQKYLTIYLAERIGDIYHSLLTFLQEEKETLPSVIFELHKELNEFFSKVYDFVLNPKHSGAHAIAVSYRKIKKQIEEELTKNKGQARILSFLHEIARTVVNIQEIWLANLKENDS